MTSAEPFRFTIIPVNSGTKRPALAAGFRYDDFEYGRCYADDEWMRNRSDIGFVTSQPAALAVIDVDNPGAFGNTALGKVLHDLHTTVNPANGHYHVYFDMRGWEGDWPVQWATAEWPYDVKSNGFVRSAPAYVPVEDSAMYPFRQEILDAIAADRASYALMFPGRGTAQGEGLSGDWDSVTYDITSDNQLTADIASMVVTGLDDEEIFERVREHLVPLTTDWTDEQIQSKISTARAKFWQAAEAAAGERDFWDDAFADLDVSEDDILSRPDPTKPASHPANLPRYDTRPTPVSLVQAGGWFQPGGDDQSVALQAVQRLYGIATYCSDSKGWIGNAGARWEPTEADTWISALGEIIPIVPEDGPDDESDVKADKKMRRMARAKFRASAGMLSLKAKLGPAASMYRMDIEQASLDNDNDVIWANGLKYPLAGGPGVQDCTPHLRTAAYSPEPGEHPLFDAMLEALWPDKAVREWALLAFGRCFHGRGTDKHGGILELRGETNTGKSAIALYMMRLLGDTDSGGYAAILTDDLFDSTVESARALGQLPGSRMAYLDEWTDRHGKISTTRLKAITGGLPFKARLLRENAVTYNAHHTFVVSLNTEVSLPYGDAAVMERIVPIPFENRDQDAVRKTVQPALDAIVTEGPAVMATMLQMAARCLEDPKAGTKYDAPVSVLERHREAVMDSNPVAEWADCYITLEGAAETDVRDLLDSYLSNARLHGWPVMNTRAFGRRLASVLGSDLRRRSNGRVLWKCGFRPVTFH